VRESKELSNGDGLASGRYLENQSNPDPDIGKIACGNSSSFSLIFGAPDPIDDLSALRLDDDFSPFSYPILKSQPKGNRSHQSLPFNV
jgi:hypothetical protein